MLVGIEAEQAGQQGEGDERPRIDPTGYDLPGTSSACP
jgi:hypothetical protein